MLNSLIDKITHEPLRHWHRFVKGFSIFIIGVLLWFADLGLIYLGLSDRTVDTYGNPAKIVSLVFLVCGTVISVFAYTQILICRLLPSRSDNSRKP